MHQLFKPVIPVEEALAELRSVLESGWLGLGPRTSAFEEALSGFIGGGTRFAALNSCTAALHLALRLLDLPKGHKVITTPITFVSTNHALLYEGLQPLFCDVEPETGNLDPEAVEKALNLHSVAAILVVHIGGYPADMDRINALARSRGIPVIEDCAHAFGARYRNGACVGDTDNLCAWSFQAVKNLAIGDGGALSSRNPAHLRRAKKLRWLGIDQDTHSRFRPATEGEGGTPHYKWDYDVPEIGFKYHMNDLQAALGLVQLRHVEAANARRAEIAARYRRELGGLPGVRLPAYAAGDFSSHHFYPLFFSDRDRVYQVLSDRDILPGMHYKRNDRYPMFAGCPKVSARGDGLPGAETYEATEMTLPLHLALTDADVALIVAAVRAAVAPQTVERRIAESGEDWRAVPAAAAPSAPSDAPSLAAGKSREVRITAI